MANKTRVSVNGYGVIGKRVADAVRLQPDMELVGVADVVYDYRVRTGAIHNIPIYAAADDKANAVRSAGISVAGTLPNLLEQSDVVVDCTPKGVGARNFELYRKAGVKGIFQGGEKHSLTGHSFVAQANYETAVGKEATRVVSCNTTSIVRTLGALRNAGLLKKARGVLMRRATDIWESDHGGIMNTIVPEEQIPSHQGPDAQTVIPDLDIVTIAAKAPITQDHNHYWVVELTRNASRDEVRAAFLTAPRIAFIRMKDGVAGLNSVIELMRDLGRPRGDLWEVALWEDVVTVQGNELFYTYAVANEAIVIPETIDAIRAVAGVIQDGATSVRMTDEALGIRRDFLTVGKQPRAA